MKKRIIFLLTISLIMSLGACTDHNNEAETQNTQSDDLTSIAEGVMTCEEFAAAEMGAAIVMETSIQEKQSWEDSRSLIQMLNENGTAIWCMVACSEETYEKLDLGMNVILMGHKGDVNGEPGILDATIEIIE